MQQTPNDENASKIDLIVWKASLTRFSSGFKVVLAVYEVCKVPRTVRLENNLDMIGIWQKSENVMC